MAKKVRLATVIALGMWIDREADDGKYVRPSVFPRALLAFANLGHLQLFYIFARIRVQCKCKKRTPYPGRSRSLQLGLSQPVMQTECRYVNYSPAAARDSSSLVVEN